MASYQHGKPYKLDNAVVPKSLLIRQRPAFSTIREVRSKAPTLIRDPTTQEELLVNVRVSLLEFMK